MKKIKKPAEVLSEQPRKKFRYLPTFLRNKKILLLLIFLGGFLVFKSLSPGSGKEKTPVFIVQKNKLTETISASGEISAEKIAYMYFPASGKIAWLGVTEGQTVHQYQALASLDKTVLDAAYQQAQNMVRKYSATVDSVHDALKNKDKSETYSERDTRTTAEATNDYYFNALRAAEYNLKNATLIAPFNGIVTGFTSGMSVGAYFPATSYAFIVADPSTTYFLTQINETDVTKINQGLKVEITLDAYPNKVFVSNVTVIDFAPVTTSTGGTAYKVRASLPDNVEMKFKLGMNGDAKFVINEKPDIITVPQSAVIEDNGKNYVWIVNNNSRILKKEVKLGASSIDEYEITEGLNVSDKILSQPSNKLKPNTKISPE